MASVNINFPVVMAIMFAILLLTTTVPTSECMRQPSYSEAGTPSPKGTHGSTNEAVTCQSEGSLCPGGGPYDCCEGLSCVRPEVAGVAPGGVGVCSKI